MSELFLEQSAHVLDDWEMVKHDGAMHDAMSWSPDAPPRTMYRPPPVSGIAEELRQVTAAVAAEIEQVRGVWIAPAETPGSPPINPAEGDTDWHYLGSDVVVLGWDGSGPAWSSDVPPIEFDVTAAVQATAGTAWVEVIWTTAPPRPDFWPRLEEQHREGLQRLLRAIYQQAFRSPEPLPPGMGAEYHRRRRARARRRR